MGMYGADVAQLRALARQFDDVADRLESTSVDVSNSIKISAWVGPFAVSFRLSWDSAHRVKLGRASGVLRENALKLRKNADDQERVSAREVASHASSRKEEEYGVVDPQVAEYWRSLSTSERVAILRRMAQLYADRYGVRPPDVRFEDLDDGNGNSLGYWSEQNQRLVLDTTDLADPTYAINTLAHEMRHAGQHEMFRDASPGAADVEQGYVSGVWSHSEVSADDARRWGENFDRYQTPDKDFKKYWSQPVEVDARAAGRNAVNNITVEQLRELNRGGDLS